jgi:hypothetical protein
MTTYFPADFSENYINQSYQPQFCNFKKECGENNTLYSRSKPIDGISKNIILPPRMMSTSKCNLVDYNRQCYLFPSKTETLIKNTKPFDETYCQQNFVNIDDESFLYNINTPADKYKEFNIEINVSNDLVDNANILSGNDTPAFMKTGVLLDDIDEYIVGSNGSPAVSSGENKHPKGAARFVVNRPTKRRNLIKF